jgi:hypothetical protein
MYKPVDDMETQTNLSSLSKDILRSLIYSNLFRYPLTAKELAVHSSLEGTKEEQVNEQLEELVSQKLIRKDRGLFFLPHQTHGIVNRRMDGNTMAERHVNIAFRMSRIIASFPFVRGIYLSGSISKGYMDRHSDIDYFIVTEPGRLWFARTLLILFKKIFLLNSKKYFCMNYFVDNLHLEIQDKNIFTAKELYSLIPTYSKDTYYHLLVANQWAKEYLPNFTDRSTPFVIENTSFIKYWMEKLFSGKITNALDTLCMKATEGFWRFKFRNQAKAIGSIRCKKHVSKFHPKSFEFKILSSFYADIANYERTYKVNLQV